MSFQTNEGFNSRPIFCYTFARMSTVWRYTSQPTDVTVDGVSYRAAVIVHEALKQDNETAAGTLVVQCAEQTPVVADLGALGLQGAPITITIRQTHAVGVGGVTSATTAVRFKGVVQGRERDGTWCKFTIAAAAGMMDRPLLRVITAPTCQNAIYDGRCGVDPSLWSTTACAITAISGRVVSVAEAALQVDGYYTASPCSVEDGSAAGELLMVEDHTGTDLTLMHDPPSGLTVGDHLTIRKGCDGSEASCISFNNQAWFMGFPRVPTVNPWDNANP